jgi:hypothetical protein
MHGSFGSFTVCEMAANDDAADTSRRGPMGVFGAVGIDTHIAATLVGAVAPVEMRNVMSISPL